MTATPVPAADPPNIRLFGIRHHGPGSARAVAEALGRDPADIVLIEGPADAEGLIPLVADADMRPPVAMLAYRVDRPERAFFDPLAAFSPEWVALTWGVAADVPVRFIDLPARVTLAAEAAADDTDEPVDQPLVSGPPRPSDPIASLAEAAGYDDPERWWEDVVEHRHQQMEPEAEEHADSTLGSRDAAFDAIADAMTALRAVYEPLGEPTELNEARREAQMRTGIRKAVADGYRNIAVVCGAWHVPALAKALAPKQAKIDSGLLRGLPKVKAAVTWVPWTHRRLASGLGYGAGVTAPGWYHHLHQHRGPAVIARWFAEAAQVLRHADLDVSAADVVEATRLADMLAVVRGRPLAGLSEVDDAARAVLGQGSDMPMRLISNELVIGTHIGSVPDSTPMVPLARSLAAEQKACRLKPEGELRSLELDLRRPLDLARSQLLHRLVIIGVPWGRTVEGRASIGTFREAWSLRWEPEFEVRIIEASALGTTVVAAAGATLLHRLDATASLAQLTAGLEAALVAELDDVVPQLLKRVADASAQSDDVPRLLEVVPTLARTARYGDVRGTDGDALGKVITGAMVRVAAGLPTACVALDNDGAAAMAIQIRDAQAALSLGADPVVVDLWHRALGELEHRDRVHGLIHGVATRVLADCDVLTAAEVERRVARRLSRGVPPLDGATFVEGFVGESGALVVHDPVLLGVFDGWLSTLPIESFNEALPLLRRTFGAFEPAERRAIGERIRRGEPAGVQRAPSALDPQRVAAALATVGHLLGVDA